MSKKQDRRSINVPIEVHEELSYLQANVRVLLKDQKIDHMLSKTAMTKVLIAAIKSANVATLAKLLK